MQLIFIGAPGSGKGTQANRLTKELGYNHISTGDLLRSEVAKESPLGTKIKDIIDAGNLVDDELVMELLSKNCSLSSGRYIFDGFPRNVQQCKMLDQQVLSSQNYKVILFKIDNEVIVERIINRRVAADSGKIYNLITSPPLSPGVCDETGEVLVHRDDDKRDVVEKRMEIFDKTINPMIDYYRAGGKLVELDASLDPNEVFNKLTELIE